MILGTQLLSCLHICHASGNPCYHSLKDIVITSVLFVPDITNGAQYPKLHNISNIFMIFHFHKFKDRVNPYKYQLAMHIL